MVVFPNAKINIGLNILRKRSDGYHDLETLFFPVGVKDALEYVVIGGTRVNFTNTGLVVGGDPENNIILRAYRLLAEEFPLPGLDIHLHKVIPFGSGLGGGSSDAAFFLRSLNEYFELQLTHDRLKDLTLRLGADCSFFLENRPVIATGRGEIMSPASVSLAGWWLVLVKPPSGVDTREAYTGVTPREYPLDFRAILEAGPDGWKETIRNDFEESLFPRYPEIGGIKQILYRQGAVYASMSGSGSSVYGIFRETPLIGPADFPGDYFFWMERLS